MRKFICLILALSLISSPASANPALSAPIPPASAPSQTVAYDTYDSGNANLNANNATAHDPVYTNSGEYGYTAQDLFIPGRGLPMAINRTYKSQKAYNGHIGYGWFIDYHVQLKRAVGGIVTIMKGDGQCLGVKSCFL